VARVSRLKALAVERDRGDVVIAADTIVVCEGKMLGKPRDESDAFRILSLLSGRTHEVMTGMTVLRDEEIVTHTEVTKIHFRDLHPEEVSAYIATGEPMDKAGAYAIQGGAAPFVAELDGEYENVVGFPVVEVREMLTGMGMYAR
jgi:septum formation protein